MVDLKKCYLLELVDFLLITADMSVVNWNEEKVSYKILNLEAFLNKQKYNFILLKNKVS
jgi:hypothetical protein